MKNVAFYDYNKDNDYDYVYESSVSGPTLNVIGIPIYYSV